MLRVETNQYVNTLSFLRDKVDSNIESIDEILTNEKNEEWFVAVSYADGSKGAIEGDGTRITKVLSSRTAAEHRMANDPEELFLEETEPREA